MLCHFRQTRKGYVATRFILLSGTAQSSATRGYVIVSERSGQKKARAKRNLERTKKKASLVSNSEFFQRIKEPHVSMNFLHCFYVLCFMYFFFLM